MFKNSLKGINDLYFFRTSSKSIYNRNKMHYMNFQFVTFEANIIFLLCTSKFNLKSRVALFAVLLSDKKLERQWCFVERNNPRNMQRM